MSHERSQRSYDRTGRDLGLAQAQGRLPHRSRAHHEAAAAGPHLGARPARSHQRLLRSGARRARARRKHQSGSDLRRDTRPLLAGHGYRPRGRHFHQSEHQRTAQVPLRHKVFPLRRRGRGTLHPSRLHFHGVPRQGRHAVHARCRRDRGERMVGQVLPGGGWGRGTLRFPAARSASAQHSCGRAR